MIIPQDARFAMCALREGVSLETFLDDVWHRRDLAQGVPTPDRNRWPFVKGGQEEARVNVAQLPSSLRKKA